MANPRGINQYTKGGGRPVPKKKNETLMYGKRKNAIKRLWVGLIKNAPRG